MNTTLLLETLHTLATEPIFNILLGVILVIFGPKLVRKLYVIFFLVLFPEWKLRRLKEKNHLTEDDDDIL